MIKMFELPSRRLPGWVFAVDISVAAGQHEMGPLNREHRVKVGIAAWCNSFESCEID